MGIFDRLFGKKKEEYRTTMTSKNGIRTIKSYWNNNQLYQEGIQKDISISRDCLWKNHGLWKQYYKNGQLRGEINWKEGGHYGKQKTYYENGQLKLDGNKKNGKFDGVLKMYYENGQLETEGNFKEGKKDGVFKDYYENGQLESERNYKEGKLKSKKCWDESGNVIEC